MLEDPFRIGGRFSLCFSGGVFGIAEDHRGCVFRLADGFGGRCFRAPYGFRRLIRGAFSECGGRFFCEPARLVGIRTGFLKIPGCLTVCGGNQLLHPGLLLRQQILFLTQTKLPVLETLFLFDLSFPEPDGFCVLIRGSGSFLQNGGSLNFRIRPELFRFFQLLFKLTDLLAKLRAVAAKRFVLCLRIQKELQKLLPV